ncbi:hypothetical protein, partial [Lysinibacillus sp. D4A1_S13]|uniref:hypothetical protein n=1 Tax=Lysinibacillus sp. D4A1_S13 TaxID=2941228 RepID=UPI0020C077D1
MKILLSSANIRQLPAYILYHTLRKAHEKRRFQLTKRLFYNMKLIVELKPFLRERKAVSNIADPS